MPVSERYLVQVELDELIEISNEAGASRPKDER